MDAGDGQFITTDAFDTADQIGALGLDLDDLVDIVNNGVQLGRGSNASVVDSEDSDDFGTPALQVAHNAALQASAVLISVILDVRALPFLNTYIFIITDVLYILHLELRTHTRPEHTAWQ